MSKLNKYLEDIYYSEMANINSKRSGIDEGYIKIKNEKAHPEFPHVHYVHNLKKSRIEFVKFTIHKDIEKIQIIEQKMKITKKEEIKVKEFISKNSQLLRKYYFQGETIDTDDFLDSIKKI